MRRLITSSIIFLLVLSFSVGGKLYIDDCSSRLISLLSQADEQIDAGNKQAAESLISQAEKQWGKAKMMLSVYMINDELDRIEASIKVAKVAAQSSSNARIYITNSINLLEGLKGSQKISIENII